MANWRLSHKSEEGGMHEPYDLELWLESNPEIIEAEIINYHWKPGNVKIWTE